MLIRCLLHSEAVWINSTTNKYKRRAAYFSKTTCNATVLRIFSVKKGLGKCWWDGGEVEGQGG